MRNKRRTKCIFETLHVCIYIVAVSMQDFFKNAREVLRKQQVLLTPLELLLKISNAFASSNI